MKTTVLDHSNEVGMIGYISVRQSLKTLAPALVLLLCYSIGAFAQTPSEAAQELISFKEITLKAAIYSLGTELGLNIFFDEAIKDSEGVNIELIDISFRKATDIVLLNKKMQAAIIAEKTIVIFPDNEDNRKKYGQYEFWLPPWRPTYCGRL